MCLRCVKLRFLLSEDSHEFCIHQIHTGSLRSLPLPSQSKDQYQHLRRKRRALQYNCSICSHPHLQLRLAQYPRRSSPSWKPISACSVEATSIPGWSWPRARCSHQTTGVQMIIRTSPLRQWHMCATSRCSSWPTITSWERPNSWIWSTVLRIAPDAWSRSSSCALAIMQLSLSMSGISRIRARTSGSQLQPRMLRVQVAWLLPFDEAKKTRFFSLLFFLNYWTHILRSPVLFLWMRYIHERLPRLSAQCSQGGILTQTFHTPCWS